MQKLIRIRQSPGMHRVGNSFPVPSVFDYNGLGQELSPFLLLDHAAPYQFPPESAFKECHAGQMGDIH